MRTATDTIERSVTPGEQARWKSVVSHLSAGLLAALFLVSGLWKILDIPATAERMVQSLIPPRLSTPAAILVASTETLAAVLLLFPRFRRWGAWLAALMLVAFMAYIGIFYNRLLGDDCNCFPWIRRVVGPAFFAGDAGMLFLAAVAGWGARRSRGLKPAVAILAGILAVALSSYGLSVMRRSHIVAPPSIEVGGQARALHQGRVLLFFFDPECLHCLAAAREMSRHDWNSAVIAIPTGEPQFADYFLKQAGLKASVSHDAALLRRTFLFTDPPYAVALDDGDQMAAFTWEQIDKPSFYETMEKLGFTSKAPRR
jgi:uncharacterized membrane protein YphA (DoxX/SURF4 family)